MFINIHSTYFLKLNNPNDDLFHKLTGLVFLENVLFTLPSFSLIKAVRFLVAAFNSLRVRAFVLYSFALR